MHRDYVLEQWKIFKCSEFDEPISDCKFLEIMASDEMIDYCAENGNEKISSIAKTMQQCDGYRYVNSYKRMTVKQCRAIAGWLLEHFGSVEDVLKKLYGIEKEELQTIQKGV